MTAIVQPIASSSGGGGSSNPAINARGFTSGLAPLATTTLVSVPSWGTRKLRGFRVSGTTDAEAWVEVDGTELWGSRSRISRVLDGYFVMPNAEAFGATVTVTLRVQNTDGTSGDFGGTLFGE